MRNSNRFEGRLGMAAGSAFAIKIGLGSLWLLALLLIVPRLPQNAFVTQLVLLGAISVLFEELGNTGLAVFKASLRNDITVRLVVISQILLLFFTVLLTAIGVNEPAPYLYVRVLSTAVGTFIFLVSVFRFTRIRLQLTDIFRSLRGTASFGLSHGLAVIYERADITIIAFFLGETAAGIYSPAISLMTTLFLVPTAVYEVMLPHLSQIYNRNKSEIKKAGFKLFLLSAVLGVLLGVGLIILAYPLVWLIYSAEFAESAPILIILSNVLLFKAMSFALAAILAAVGWQSRRVVIQAVSAIVNIGLNVYIVQIFGIDGVAYVYVLTEFILTTGYLFYFLRWQKQVL